MKNHPVWDPKINRNEHATHHSHQFTPDKLAANPRQSARAVSTVHQPGQQMRACGAWVEQDSGLAKKLWRQMIER